MFWKQLGLRGLAAGLFSLAVNAFIADFDERLEALSIQRADYQTLITVLQFPSLFSSTGPHRLSSHAQWVLTFEPDLR